MKIGVIADIHGNLPALEVILAEFSRRRVSEIICAGDIVGYFPYVNEVIREIRSLDVLTIMGNHDLAVVEGSVVKESHSATAGVQYARKVIDPENLRFLSNLAAFRVVRLGGVDITLFHGTPRNPLKGRVQSVADFDLTMVRPGLAVGGHTHIPMAIRRNGVDYVNPGSCGQPRDFNVRASSAIVDLDTMSVEFIRQLYDIDAVDERMAVIGFDRRIAWSLYTGEWIGESVLSPSAVLKQHPDLERSYVCQVFRYCLQFTSREDSSYYNCYIQDGLACLISSPRYTDNRTIVGCELDQLKVNANAVAAFKILDLGSNLTSKDFEELDVTRRALGG